MLNQVPFEALYSATYVENYLDCVENLPDALQRHLTRMRELDVSYRACLRDVENNIGNCFTAKETDASHIQSNKRTRAIARIQQSLIAAQELGDEKLQIVQVIQDIIDNTSRQLDGDYRKLASCLECGNGGIKEELSSIENSSTIKESNLSNAATTPLQQSSANGGSAAGRPPTPPHSQDRDRDRNEKDRTGERASKRARRSRTDTISGNDVNERVSGVGMTTSGSGSGTLGAGAGATSTAEREQAALPAVSPAPDPPQRTTTNSNNSSHKKTGAGKIGTGKKKKRKCRQSAAQTSQRDETPPPEDPDTIDPDEPTYCLCDQISFGEMILCDNDLCPIEWFHFSCVSLATKPKGKWFCPKCRGDRPNIMKPKVQFLKELERYNKEKEEKA